MNSFRSFIVIVEVMFFFRFVREVGGGVIILVVVFGVSLTGRVGGWIGVFSC